MDKLPYNDNRHDRGRPRVCGGVRPVLVNKGILERESLTEWVA